MRQNNIKILYVTGSLSRGGAETWYMNMLRNLDREHIQIDFLLLSGEVGDYGPEVEQLGSKIFVTELNKKNPLIFIRDFYRTIQSGNYDIVHSHVLGFSGFILLLSYMLGVSHRFAHFHTSKLSSEEKTQGLLRKIYITAMKNLLKLCSTRRIACSKVAMEGVWGKNWINDTKCEILYYGIDFSPFKLPVDQNLMRQELNIPASARVIGHVGNIRLAKNHDFLVDIAAELCRRRQDVRFVLVGDGSRRQHIENLISQRGLKEFFILTGSRSDVPDLMKIMDVFLLPSVREGLPVVLIEAQAAGLPLVTSQLPAIEETILSSNHKSLPLDSPRLWAEACDDILNLDIRKGVDGEMWEKLELFSVEYCVKRLVAIYESAVKTYN
jgi:glycosyltransferase involved in cell wall biosynthesis